MSMLSELLKQVDESSVIALLLGGLMLIGVASLAFRKLYKIFEADVSEIVKDVLQDVLDSHDKSAEAHPALLKAHNGDPNSHPERAQKIAAIVQVQADMSNTLGKIERAVDRIETFLLNKQWKEDK